MTIHLRDTNDHRPTFPSSMYNLSIFEHSPVGYVVTDSIRVSDGTGLDWAGRGVEMGRPGAGPARVSASSGVIGSQQACMYM